MRIGVVARLAEVSVRRIRHYHQLGLLAEPPRTGGGFREYDVADLVRVIHIRTLSDSGIPLRAIPDVLDRTGDETIGEIETVRRDLDEQIAELTRRREKLGAIASRLAAGDGVFPLPREVSRTFDRLLDEASGDPSVHRHLRYERDALELLALATDFPPELADSIAAIGADTDRRGRYLGLLRDFAAIEGRTVSAVEDLIERIVDALASDPVIRGFIVDRPPGEPDEGDGPTLENLVADPTQREALRRLFARLEADDAS